MRFWLISFIFFISNVGIAQMNEDLTLIQGRSVEIHNGHENVRYLFNNSAFFIKYNPVSAVVGGLLYVYQKVISPQIFADCLYQESCSKFSVLVLKEFGFLKGIGLTTDRITRCNQLVISEINVHRIELKSGRLIDSLEWYR
jgi:putative membrane protein insertion efficiency factor